MQNDALFSRSVIQLSDDLPWTCPIGIPSAVEARRRRVPKFRISSRVIRGQAHGRAFVLILAGGGDAGPAQVPAAASRTKEEAPALP